MWQPIETAPKDGTQVDLWCLGQFSQGRICDCWFYENRWWQYSETGDEWCRAEVHNATHWMPIRRGQQTN